eukprot:364748_1
MSTNLTTETWTDLATFPVNVTQTRGNVPTGIDGNNDICIDYTWNKNDGGKINCIYKYNTNTDKWNPIDGFNDIQTTDLLLSSAINVKEQILFLSSRYYVTQIQLNNGKVIRHHNNPTKGPPN